MSGPGLAIKTLWTGLTITGLCVAMVPATGRGESPRSRMQPVFDDLRAQGVEDIVFALRQRGRDSHWYANFGYFADSTSRLTYSPGGKLCRDTE